MANGPQSPPGSETSEPLALQGLVVHGSTGISEAHTNNQPPGKPKVSITISASTTATTTSIETGWNMKAIILSKA